LPLKAAQCDAIANLKSFWSFVSELQTNPMPFHSDSPWGATLMPLRAFAMDWERNRILTVGKNSGLISSLLWTKVHAIPRRRSGPLYFQTLLPDCLVTFWRYSPLSLEVVENRTNVSFWLSVFLGERRPRLFYGRLLALFTIRRLAKFRLLRSLAMKWNAEFTEGG